jgi:hypothetical protein
MKTRETEYHEAFQEWVNANLGREVSTEDTFVDGASWADSHSLGLWRNPKEDLPPIDPAAEPCESEAVLILEPGYFHKYKIGIARYNHSVQNWFTPYRMVGVVAWMPLPQIPDMN